jgi:hypothetical protein
MSGLTNIGELITELGGCCENSISIEANVNIIIGNTGTNTGIPSYEQPVSVTVVVS